MTMSLWGHHLIHRVDDAVHFKLTDPHGSHEWPFTIFTKTTWFKNVTRIEKECPHQIIFGAMDWKCCMFMHLANYMEMFIAQKQDVVHLWTVNDDVKKGPTNIKQQY